MIKFYRIFNNIPFFFCRWYASICVVVDRYLTYEGSFYWKSNNMLMCFILLTIKEVLYGYRFVKFGNEIWSVRDWRIGNTNKIYPVVLCYIILRRNFHPKIEFRSNQIENWRALRCSKVQTFLVYIYYSIYEELWRNNSF